MRTLSILSAALAAALIVSAAQAAPNNAPPHSGAGKAALQDFHFHRPAELHSVSAAPHAAGINTSRSNARSSGAAAEGCPQPSARAVDTHLPIRGEKGARGEAPNRGYVVGSQGTARVTDITVNEEGIESPCAGGRGPATSKRASVATGDVNGDRLEAPQAEGGSGRASGRR